MYMKFPHYHYEFGWFYVLTPKRNKPVWWRVMGYIFIYNQKIFCGVICDVFLLFPARFLLYSFLICYWLMEIMLQKSKRHQTHLLMSFSSINNMAGYRRVSLVGRYCEKALRGLGFDSSKLSVDFSQYGLLARPDLTWPKGTRRWRHQ